MEINSWHSCLLKDIAKIDMGQSPSGDTYNEEKIGIPLINGPTEFRARYPIKIQWTSKPTKVCQIGDILICVRGSSTGRINIADDSYCIGRGVAAIRYINKEGSTPYLEYLLRFYTQQILARSGGSTFPNLDKHSLENIDVLVAPVEEQRKIAEILSSWDKAIALLEQLITTKRKLKQGLMQQLLTGKKRFKEFEGGEWNTIPEGWSNIPIGKICHSIVPGRNKPKKFDGDIPWITTPNITRKYISENDTNKFVSKQEIRECGGKIVPQGAIVINCVGDFGIIGITEQEIVINQQLHAFICPANLSNEYIFYALTIQTPYMSKLATTTTIPYMNKNSCESIPVFLPPLPEQQKIASILSTADTEISTLEKQLAAYKQQKRGLMQQLLTGKKRVKIDEPQMPKI